MSILGATQKQKMGHVIQYNLIHKGLKKSTLQMTEYWELSSTVVVPKFLAVILILIQINSLIESIVNLIP